MIYNKIVPDCFLEEEWIKVSFKGLYTIDWTAIAAAVAVLAFWVTRRAISKPYRDKIKSFKERFKTDILIPLLEKYEEEIRICTSSNGEVSTNLSFKDFNIYHLKMKNGLDDNSLEKYFIDNKVLKLKQYYENEDNIISSLDVPSLDLFYNKEEREFFNYLKSKKIITSLVITKLHHVQESGHRPISPVKSSALAYQGEFEFTKLLIGYKYHYTVSRKIWNDTKKRYNKKSKDNLVLEEGLKKSIIGFLFK